MQSKLLPPAESYDQVYRYGLWHLSRCEHSLLDIKTKLQRKTTNNTWIDQAISRYQELAYIDDTRFCGMYIRSHSRLHSQRQIRSKLQQKGISAEIIEQSWQDEVSNDDLQELAERLIAKHEKKSGLNKLRQVLQQAQIPSFLIDELLNELCESAEPQKVKALTLLNQKFKTACAANDRKLRDKQTRFLLSKGFDFSVIRFCLDHHLMNPEEIDDIE